ncbi:MAG: SseB family protein [Acidimicrobiales bacterium]|nr:SseB family protein [Acidimicrobiales bacterium]
MPSNDRLAEAMRIVAADDTPAHRADLYEAMLAADLLVLTPEAPATAGPAPLEPDEAVELVTIADDETDGLVLAVFTSEQAILRFGQPAGCFLAMPARELFAMADGAGVAGVVIDHGSPTHGILGPAEVAALARGHLPTEDGEIVRAASEVRVGVPSEPLAPDVVAAVRAALAAERHADAAWLFVLHQPPADPQLVVAVALDEALDDDARAAAMRAVVTHAGEQAPGARVLGFVAAEADLRGQLDGGGAIELYRR